MYSTDFSPKCSSSKWMQIVGISFFECFYVVTAMHYGLRVYPVCSAASKNMMAWNSSELTPSTVTSSSLSIH